MTDFTVKPEKGSMLKVMVSSETRAARSFQWYVGDLSNVFRELAEAFGSEIQRVNDVSFFLIHSSSLAELQAALVGHGCSVQLLDTVQKNDTLSH